MAQQDAMEQVKEVLRQLIKYRFWIAISAAALFGLIAYFLGAGPVQEAAKKETANIKKAATEVEGYRSPTIPTKEYQPLVQEKTAILTKDVNTAWKTLYDRQAPLLTWPDTVQERFRKWGRKWPDDIDASRVQLAQIDYINAYKDYVDMVYKTFKPFDYETGEGIVAAPPKELLLRPTEFSEEHLPGLSKIWSAQERLWIQRTLLEVVSQVNKNAKDWNSAVIREIEAMEVGNPNAQDQHSLAKNEELQEAEKILAPGETEETEAAPGGSMSSGGKLSQAMPGMGMGRGARGAAGAESESVFYVKSGNEQQYRILPVQMTVLIDQDHVQDLLVELENSPMSIEVKDFELQRPTSRVVKPEKGTTPNMGSGMMGMGMGMGMGSMMGGRGMRGYGGMAGEIQSQMSARMGMGMGMGMNRMGGMQGGTGTPERKGTDVRNTDRAKMRKEQEEKISKAKGPSLFDPYFDIVEVTVYGQARFFRPPPADATAEPSPGETPAVASAGATPATTAAATTGTSAGETAAVPSVPGAAQPKPASAPAGTDEADGSAKTAASAKESASSKGGDAAAKAAVTPEGVTKPVATPTEPAKPATGPGPATKPQSPSDPAKPAAPSEPSKGAAPKG